MCGGQMIDLLAEKMTDVDIGAITRLQRLKTGELFAFAAVSGAVLGKGSYRSYMALHNYAQEFGLAFQIADDLLDAGAPSALWAGELHPAHAAHPDALAAIGRLEPCDEVDRLDGQRVGAAVGEERERELVAWTRERAATAARDGVARETPCAQRRLSGPVG